MALSISASKGRKDRPGELTGNLGNCNHLTLAGDMKKPTYDIFKSPRDVKAFMFRDLHHRVSFGTASDRYAGWIGQIYTKERYEGHIERRTNTVGGKSFIEEVLPVESVQEYFEHFSVLEIDFTFYSPLIGKDGKPTQNYQFLRKYRQFMKEGDKLDLKVPQVISAQRVHRGGQYVENENYLSAEMFTDTFYKPATQILGTKLSGMIFEQEYQRKQDRVPVKKMAEDLERFFESIPKDTRYHIELRTEAYLSAPVFKVMEKHGVGQVLSHWTWLPPLRKQLAKANHRVFNSGRQRIVRLMTPIGMRYPKFMVGEKIVPIIRCLG
jgi:uncharacterized protein YecE (DUF72 family)